MADCKRKTANLFNVSLTQGVWAGNTGEAPYVSPSTRRICTSTTINLDSTKTYTVAPRQPDLYVVVKILDSDGNIVSDSGWKSSVTFSNAYGILVTFRFINESNISPQDFMGAMLNEGDTALPYEPYGWVHSLRKLTTSTDTFTTLPAVIYADGTNATVGISGNTVQNGTPTPSSPIQPSECGEMSSNLYNVPDKSATANSLVTLVDLGADTTFNTITISCMFDNLLATSANGAFLDFLKDDNTHQYVALSNMYNVADDTPVIANTITTGNYYATKNNITFRYIKAYLYSTAYNKFQSGTIKWAFYDSEKKDYEPYGYKIPISSGGVTTNIYLGSTQTVRQIKKLVLDGTENITSGHLDVSLFNIPVTGYLRNLNTTALVCTHYKAQKNVNGWTEPQPYTCTFYAGAVQSDLMYIRDPNCTTVEEFKSYLAAQYANGTPVTVWYVLATPETAAVNEPLMKIGDYADTVSDITIPTITSKDTFDVLTTLKPSEVSLSYTGWHDATVEEWDGSQWNE